MASDDHLDHDDDFGGDFSGNNSVRHSGTKRSFGDIEDEEDDLFDSEKGDLKIKETAPGAATGMILALRESLQNCKSTLATCQSELEAANSEIQKWHSSFLTESFVPTGAAPEPKLIIKYLQSLKSSEETLREQLEKAKKKEAAFIVTFAKREQEIAELKSAVRDLKAQLKPPSMQARKLFLDPAIHEEFSRLKNLVEEKDKKVKELQDNIASINFTPQSKMGKMLMAKCRTLQEENEEIGNQASEGKMHELAMKLAIQKCMNSELRKQFEGFFLSGLHRHVDRVMSEAERSNQMVLILEEKLEEKEQEMNRLKSELQQQKSQLEEENDMVSAKKESDEAVASSRMEIEMS
ncbi:hypothetical protein SAY86_015763 [Trapa natans]|uniref:FKBP12-interacting protein of 37 kDa n=1 Tax=Trapa natans TaxID=22666 RepID=A0AAN7L955_TRANT|nr:hypothetical protein SAY86_015763 [Trapa natans]